VRVLPEDLCELLAEASADPAVDEDVRSSVFAKQIGAPCTDSADFADHVGTLVVTGKAQPEAVFVVPPETCTSVEALGGGFAAGDKLLVIDSNGTCGVTPGSRSVEFCPETVLYEDLYGLCIDSCALGDPFAVVEDPSCMDKDHLPDEIAAAGIDVDFFAEQGNCPGAVKGIVDEDGHTCSERLSSVLPTFFPSAGKTTLCDVCCLTCRNAGQDCPGADEARRLTANVDPACIDECVGSYNNPNSPEGRSPPPYAARRRRAATYPPFTALTHPPFKVTSGGEFKVCFCDSARADCTAPSAYDVEVGTLRASGIACLLEQGLSTGECVPQSEGGLRCT
jgi:hypothetical protein